MGQELSDRFQCDAQECKGSKELLEVMESGLARNKGSPRSVAIKHFYLPKSQMKILTKKQFDTGKQKLRNSFRKSQKMDSPQSIY